MERSHYHCFQEGHVVGFVLWLLISRIRSRCSLSTYFIMQQETKGNDKWILHYFTNQCHCLPTRYGKTEDLRGVSSYSRRMDTIVVQSPASKWWICLMSSVSLIPRCSMRVITFDILLCINGRSSYYSTVILPTSFYYKEKAVEGIMQDGCTETRRLSMKMETILHHCACLSAFQSMLNVIMQRKMSKSITLKGVMSWLVICMLPVGFPHYPN